MSFGLLDPHILCKLIVVLNVPCCSSISWVKKDFGNCWTLSLAFFMYEYLTGLNWNNSTPSSHSPMCVYWDSRFIRPVEDWKLGAVGLSSILKDVKGCSNGLDLSCSHGVGSSFDNHFTYHVFLNPFNLSFLCFICISWTWLSIFKSSTHFF